MNDRLQQSTLECIEAAKERNRRNTWWKIMTAERDQLTRVDRFHAWQSALLFSFLFLVHLLFSWSPFMSWVIFLGDLGLIVYLTMRAYIDGMLRLSSPLY